MAIDLTKERGIRAHAAAKLIPSSLDDDKPSHHSKVIRPIKSGKLEGMKCGGTWVTTVEAVRRYCEAMAPAPPAARNAQSDADPGVTPPARARSTRKSAEAA